jgi:prepilin-type N-terminal cleavage/methylation domain-containing protein
MKRQERSGFSLVELVIAIVVSGIVVYSLLSIFITAAGRNVRLEAASIALSLVSSKAEEVTSRAYSAISDEALTSFGTGYSDFFWEVESNFVSLEALDTPLATDSGYKKVAIRVSSANLPGGALEIFTVVTDAIQ